MPKLPSGFKRPGRTGQRYRKQIGKRRYEKFFYGNKQQREEQYSKWVEVLIAKHKARSWDGSKTWEFFKDRFLSYLRTATDKRTQRPLFRPRTVAEYKYALIHFEAALSPHYLNDLSYEAVAEFRRQNKAKADREQSDYYGVNKDTGCLIRALEWGMTEGYIPVINLDSLKKQFSTSKVVVSTLQPWQMDLILKYSNAKMRVAAKMGFYAGLRPEEAYSLLLGKIDFKTGIAWVSENAEDKEGGTTFWQVKRGKDRPVYFPPDLLEDILALNSPGPYVLMDNSVPPKPYNVNNFSKAWSQNLAHVNKMILKEEADTPQVACTYKIFRKTHTTMMLQVGAEEKAASLYVGHADTQVTEEHYLDPEVLKKRQEAKQLEHLEGLKKYLKKLPDTLKQ